MVGTRGIQIRNRKMVMYLPYQGTVPYIPVGTVPTIPVPRYSYLPVFINSKTLEKILNLSGKDRKMKKPHRKKVTTVALFFNNYFN